MNLDILKEYRYRLLSHITIGKTKEHYKRKWKNIKNLKISGDYVEFRPWKKGEKLKVYFLFQSKAFWPSWETFWEACNKDPEIEVKMLYCPPVTLSKRWGGQFTDKDLYLKDKKIPYVNIEDIDFSKDLPHVLVVQLPYEVHRSQEYNSNNLLRQGNRIVYISYGLEFTETPEAIKDHFMLPIYKNAWKIYKFSDFLIKDYKKYANITQSVKCVGHPKFDALYKVMQSNKLPKKLKRKIKGRKVVVWHPHFPCNKSIKDKEPVMSTFSWQDNVDILNYIEKQRDLFFVFMPHHMFWDQFECGYNVPASEISRFKEKINTLENTFLWEDDYPQILALGDAFMGERSAVTMEMLVTGKPVLYLEKNPEIYNVFGKAAVDAFYYASSAKDIPPYIDMLRTTLDPKEKKRRAVFNKYIGTYYDGKSGERIVNDIKETIKKEKLKTPEISVIMPTYNSEKYLSAAIDSILAQTFKNFELLIIDDMSTDNTRSIVKQYKDTRIKLIDGPCRGIAAALNVGINIARGKYIARMDSDDISLNTRFYEQVKFLRTHPDISLCSTPIIFFDGQSDIKTVGKKYSPAEVKAALLFATPIFHPTVMFRREDFKNNNLLYDEEWKAAEDYELWSRAAQKLQMSVLETPLLKYRCGDKLKATAINNNQTRINHARVILNNFKRMKLDVSPDIASIYDPYQSKNNIRVDLWQKYSEEITQNIKQLLRQNHKYKYFDDTALTTEVINKVRELYRLSENKNFYELLSKIKTKKQVNVCLTINEKWIPMAATTISSIMDNTISNAKFYIIHSDCKRKSIEKINQLCQKYPYMSVKWVKVNLSQQLSEFQSTVNYISNDSFSRFLFPKLVKNVDRVIYTDVDVIFRGDIQELFDENLEGKIIGAVRSVKQVDGSDNKRLQISENHKYFQSGLLLIDCKKWRKYKILEKLKLANRQSKNRLKFADQDLLNIVFVDNYKELNLKYCFIVFLENLFKTFSDESIMACQNPFIIHFCGTGKPWLTDCKHSDEFWKYAKQTAFYSRLQKIRYKEKVEKQTSEYKIYLFSLNIIKVVAKINKIKIYLLELFPLMKIKKYHSGKKYYLLGCIPIMKTKRK